MPEELAAWMFWAPAGVPVVVEAVMMKLAWAELAMTVKLTNPWPEINGFGFVGAVH